jgi:hypothetical protein
MSHHMRQSQEGTNNLRIGLYLFVYDLPLFTTVSLPQVCGYTEQGLLP